MSALLNMSQQFSGLPMDSLIGGPLNAAADANAKMAMTQTKFMLDTAFKKVDDGSGNNTYEPIIVPIKLTRSVISNDTDETTGKTTTTVTPFETTLELPLLTLIPINSLGVDNVDVSFEMEVKSSFSEEKSKTKEDAFKAAVDFEAKASYGPLSVSVKGSVTKESKDISSEKSHYEKSNSAKYTVKVHAGQLPNPKGVDLIIEAFTKNLEPVNLVKGSETQATE